MNEISQRSLIREVCNRWRRQYEPFVGVSHDKFVIYEKLKALDLETCSVEDVTAAIGNSSWTRLKCAECGKEVDWVLQVGEPPDYESATANLCRDCVRKVAEYAQPK